MPFRLKTGNVLAILILIALSVTNIYRAKTQSITCDEAFSYQLWGAEPLSHMFEAYDASNHVLQTLLSKVSVAVFGLSEFTLRLPTLLAGFFYFIAVYRLSSLVFGQGALFLLSVCVLSLNPLLLDLLSAARGYGLALAFCAWAVFYMVKGAESPFQMLRLALLLALSVSSNVTFLFVDAGLAALFVGALLAGHANRKEIGKAALKAVAYFIVPGIIFTLIVVGGPLSNAQRTDFYYGMPTLAKGADTLVHASLIHRFTLRGLEYYHGRLWRTCEFISAWIVPAILWLSGFVWLAIVFRGVRKKALLKLSDDRLLFFSVGALLFSVAASYLANKATGLLYPISRTGLPWIVFFLLVCLALARKFKEAPVALQILRWPLLVFLLACTLWFTWEFNTNQYAEWAYDAGTKRIVALLQKQHQSEPDKNWQVCVSWSLLPSMNFYKSLYHLNWFQLKDLRDGPAQWTRFVLIDRDAQLVQTLGLHTSYVDPVSSQIVATR
jgi:hypothetical protein